MKSTDQPRLGFDRRLDLDWMDAAAGQLAAGASPTAARAYLWQLLGGVLSGSDSGSARGKTCTLLTAIWLTPPVPVRPMRDAAIALVSEAAPADRQAIHWALTCAVYPFFLGVAATMGSLIALNGAVSLSQVQRRVMETWGDRSTLPRATQRTVRSMVQWGLLQDGPNKGQYLPRTTPLAVSEDATALLIEGFLRGEGRGLLLPRLETHPAAFPFELHLSHGLLRRHPRLELHRQGDQTDLVELTWW